MTQPRARPHTDSSPVELFHSTTRLYLASIALGQRGWFGPCAGSPAAAEDAIWPHTPISDVVRSSILTAHECATHAFTMLNADDAPAPVVFYTVLRGALVGASQSLWIVNCGDPQLRQARALTVLRYDHDQCRKFHGSQASSLDPDRAAHAAGFVEHWGARLHEIEQVLAGLPSVPRRLSNTDMIKWVAKTEFPVEADSVSILQSTWQVCSGYAHVLPWPNFTLPGATPIGPDREGPTPFSITFNHERAWEELATCASVLALANKAALEHAGYNFQLSAPLP